MMLIYQATSQPLMLICFAVETIHWFEFLNCLHDIMMIQLSEVSSFNLLSLTWVEKRYESIGNASSVVEIIVVRLCAKCFAPHFES